MFEESHGKQDLYHKWREDYVLDGVLFIADQLPEEDSVTALRVKQNDSIKRGRTSYIVLDSNIDPLTDEGHFLIQYHAVNEQPFPFRHTAYIPTKEHPRLGEEFGLYVFGERILIPSAGLLNKHLQRKKAMFRMEKAEDFPLAWGEYTDIFARKRYPYSQDSMASRLHDIWHTIGLEKIPKNEFLSLVKLSQLYSSLKEDRELKHLQRFQEDLKKSRHTFGAKIEETYQIASNVLDKDGPKDLENTFESMFPQDDTSLEDVGERIIRKTEECEGSQLIEQRVRHYLKELSTDELEVITSERIKAISQEIWENYARFREEKKQ